MADQNNDDAHQNTQTDSDARYNVRRGACNKCSCGRFEDQYDSAYCRCGHHNSDHDSY